jgi:hypothetical protein
MPYSQNVVWTVSWAELIKFTREHNAVASRKGSGKVKAICDITPWETYGEVEVQGLETRLEEDLWSVSCQSFWIADWLDAATLDGVEETKIISEILFMRMECVACRT